MGWGVVVMGSYLIPQTALVPVRRIIEQASRIYGIPASIILSHRRHRDYVRVRQAVCLVACEAGWSSTHIGNIMAGRDHSTILHGRDAASILAERDPVYAARLAELREFARGPADRPYIGEPAGPIQIAKTAREVISARLAKPSKPRLRSPFENDERERDSRRNGSIRLLEAIQREHPERCAA